MVTLKLNDQAAWFLHNLLDQCLNEKNKKLFKTDNGKGKKTLDPEFLAEIELVVTELSKVRGLK